ncbi:MAG: BA14K family protein [Hyphomicrobiales bacterium]|nr:BA14K family protein [Hyphomicrobiales bacterium]MCP4999908.1 BA14K family protein [Hyphomicrobiales bacterium]
MGRPVKAIIATIAVAAATIAPLSQAYAHDRGHRHYHNNNWDGPKRHHRKHKRYRGPVVIERNNNDDALLLGVLGLAAGAIITGAILSDPANQPAYNRGPQPGYSPPAQDYYPPAPTQTYAGGTLEPWTDEWYRYCARKYRSFDASTGTYRGYDGYNHFCVVR